MYLLLIASLSLVVFGLYETESMRDLHQKHIANGQKELILRKINFRIVDSDADIDADSDADKLDNLEGGAYGKLRATKKALTSDLDDGTEPEIAVFTSNPDPSHLTSSASSLRRSMHREIPKVEAYFTNASKKYIQINWVNITADTNTYEEIQLIHNLPPNKSRRIHVHPGHSFVAYDKERTFRTLFNIDDDTVVSHVDGSAISSTVRFISAEGDSTSFERDAKVEKIQDVEGQGKEEGQGLTTTVKFINSCNKPVDVYWKDNDNGEELQVLQKLMPRESASIESHKGHTFIANDEEKTFQIEFNVNLLRGVETFRIVDKRKTDNEQEAHFHPKHKNAKVNFINTSAFPVHVSWINEETGEEIEVISNLAPTQERFQDTYRGHKFVVYDEKRTFRKVFAVSVPAGQIEQFRIDDSINKGEL